MEAVDNQQKDGSPEKELFKEMHRLTTTHYNGSVWLFLCGRVEQIIYCCHLKQLTALCTPALNH